MAKENIQQLTEEVKRKAKDAGAVLVGIAPVERFDPQPPFYDEAPDGHHPKNFVLKAKSVISIAMPILNPVLDAPSVLADKDLEFIPPDHKHRYFDSFYNRVGHKVHDDMLEYIGQLVGQFLYARGFETMIFPTTGIGNTKEFQNKGKYSKFGYRYGPFSHRHAATRAGLGEFGFNNIVLTREFGPRQRFNSIITEAELSPDPLISEPICLRENCGYLCLKACHMDAITKRDDKENTDYRSVETVEETEIFIDTPSKTDPITCSKRRDYVPMAPVRGDCLRVCPVPKEPERMHRRLQEIVKNEKSKGNSS